MNTNYLKPNGCDDRQREFKRQQDRLKMMAPDVERKTVSADEMINNLLQKSNTFRKATDDLPPWVVIDSPLCCPFYESIWNIVRCSEKMVDTQAISQLLLTSGLHPDVLCFIWNLANKAVPGQLNKQELFIVLALVGLAQSNVPFSNLGVLKLAPCAPIPRLQAALPTPLVNNATVSSVGRTPLASPAPGSIRSSLESFASVKQQDFASLMSPITHTASFTSAPSRDLNSIIKSPTHLSVNQLSGPQGNSFIDDDFQDFQSSAISSHSDQTAALSSLPVMPLSSVPYAEKKDLNVHSFLPISNVSTDFLSTSIDGITLDISKTSLIDKPSIDSNNLSMNDSAISIENNTIEKKMALEDSFNSTAAASQVASDDFSDFQEFQSAQLDTEVIQPSKGIIPKLPSLYKVSPESERKLRNFSQPESLSAMPESKISSRNLVLSMPSISVLGRTQGSSNYATSREGGSRAGNSAGSKSDRNRHKHYKIKPIVSGSSPGLPEEMFPKVLSKPPSSFLLKETRIPSAELDREPPIPELTRSIEIPIVGTFKETTLPVDMKTPTVEKTSFILGDTRIASQVVGESLLADETDVDKYSALRDLNEPVATEDFGEFLSAELTTEKAVEAWSTWNKSVNFPEEGIADTKSLQNAENEFNFSTANVVPDTVKSIEPAASIDLLCDSFDVPVNPILLPTNATDSLTTPQNGGNVDADGFDEFGDFVGPNLILSPSEDVVSIKSRESSENSDVLQGDSISSFELNYNKELEKSSESNMEVRSKLQPEEVARKCLECCHGLLAEAIRIFEGIVDKSILKEVLVTSEARNYLKYLQIVNRIAQRVSRAGAVENMVVTNEISQLWKRLDSITSEYPIPGPEWSDNEDLDLPCAVCKGPTSDHDIHQNGLHYHSYCANLWINCIETSLPF